MLTTIFSGHTIDLADIVAVGPIMMERKGTLGSIYTRTMYLMIFMKHSVNLRHESFIQQIIAEPEPEQKQQWTSAHDELIEKRQELINDWNAAAQAKVTIEVDPSKAFATLSEIDWEVAKLHKT